MSLKSKFKSSSALVEGGVWFHVVKNTDGTECRVRLRRNGRGNRHWVNSFREHTTGVDTENLTPEEDELLTARVFVDANIVEWEHFQPDDDGVEVSFSKEKALEILLDPDWVDLLKDWQSKASGLAPFQNLEADAKN